MGLEKTKGKRSGGEATSDSRDNGYKLGRSALLTFIPKIRPLAILSEGKGSAEPLVNTCNLSLNHIS